MKQFGVVHDALAPLAQKTFLWSTAAVLMFACLETTGARASNIGGKVQVGAAGLPNAVVYLEGVKGNFPPPQRAVLNQRDKSFAPHVLAVMKGATIEFLNSDDFLHNTFSDSKTKVFNLNQPVKDSRSLLKVDQPGVIEVRCHIHGSMQAWIVVVDNPYFAVTDSRGIFRIQGVPPGTYKLKSWSEQHGILTQDVKVTEKDGATVIVKYAGK